MYITVSSLTLLFLLYSQFQSTFCYIDIDREHTLTSSPLSPRQTLERLAKRTAVDAADTDESASMSSLE
jgi:hypothetical protein